jgi:hypothetical protein
MTGGIARASRGAPLLLAPRRQAQLAHQGRDGVLAHPPPRITQIRGDPRRPLLSLVLAEQAGHLGFAPVPRCARGPSLVLFHL